MARGLPTHMKDEPHIRLWMNFFDDAEEAGIPLPAATAYLQMVCRCRQGRSDGWIHQARITKDRIPAKHVRLLEHRGWLVPDPSGAPRWYIAAYPKWNKVEQDYQRDRHNGRIGGCRSKHPQPCDRPDCLESQAWLATHPQPPVGPPVQPPL